MVSNYKPLNDEEVYRAVMLACVVGGCQSAEYFLCDNRLVISAAAAEINEVFLSILSDNIPKDYGRFSVWTTEEVENNVPIGVRKATGGINLAAAAENKF